MWDRLLAKQTKIAPERGSEAFAEFVKPDAVVELGVLVGPRLTWLPVKILRAAESDREYVVLYAPEREGEPELMKPGDQVLLFRYRDRQGVAFSHRVVDRRMERLAAGSMARVVSLGLFNAVYDFERRRFPRVAPSRPVEASLQWCTADRETNQVVCALQQISMVGAEVVIPHISVDAGMVLRHGAAVTLSLRLEETRTGDVVLTSEVIRAERDPRFPGKLVLGLEYQKPSPQALKTLSTYISAQTKASLRSGLAALKSLDPRSRRRLSPKSQEDEKDRLL